MSQMENLRQLQNALVQGWINTDDYSGAKKAIFQKYHGMEGLELAATAQKVLHQIYIIHT